ncbi:GtrA family protein [uncultured Methanobrevibacter sp.]|uniref:GtrA family protein n=1 Tax=uncultured Methanobrevibacter sp. TaxID=253161 RepID=UPI0025F0E5F3|nr:GtrA family protein [uncultured Methanobrevibacter sp.]
MKIERELFLYIFFGVLTTLVNIAVYLFFTRLLGVNYLISNILAWTLSVLFAYVTNRIWVFESRNNDILKEMALFFAGRIFSGVVDTGLMWLLIDVLFVGDAISKIIVQVIVVVLNYVLSKAVVFK